MADMALVGDVSPAALVAAVAAGFAIAAGFVQLVRWGRGRWTRHGLRNRLQHLCQLDVDLRNVVIKVDQAFTTGTGWAGMVEFPPKLRALVDELQRLRDELDKVIATTRALWAEGSVERARASVEDAARGLREAVDIYLAGTTEKYLGSMGEPIPHGATGRGYTHSIPKGYEEAMRGFRRVVRERMRIAVLQLDPAELNDRVLAVWPVREWEVEASPTDVDRFVLPAGT
jgi:hypothetical protein